MHVFSKKKFMEDTKILIYFYDEQKHEKATF